MLCKSLVPSGSYILYEAIYCTIHIISTLLGFPESLEIFDLLGVLESLESLEMLGLLDLLELLEAHGLLEVLSLLGVRAWVA